MDVASEVRDIPVFLNVRDRCKDLIGMVQWLEDAGQKSITFIDNASTYPPCVEYLASQGDRVVYLGENVGHLALFWRQLVPPGKFIYSDPDLVFLGPHSGLQTLLEVAKRHPERDKVGFGLSLQGVSDIPSLEWERRMWADELLVEPGVYDAPVDTTFALYNRPTQDIWNSLRTGEPDVVRHSSWYSTPENLTEEDRWYLDGANRSCSWKNWVNR